jgi:hypothetical protein
MSMVVLHTGTPWRWKGSVDLTSCSFPSMWIMAKDEEEAAAVAAVVLLTKVQYALCVS